MSYMDAYRARLLPGAIGLTEVFKDSSKQQAASALLSSQTLEQIYVNDDLTSIPAIVSTTKGTNKQGFRARKFLLLPDTPFRLGSIVKYKEYKYLTTNKNDNEVYPEYSGELCTATFAITVAEGTKTIIGEDYMGKPKYSISSPTIRTVDAVVDTTMDAASENAQFPFLLPDGSVVMKISYLPEFRGKIPLNHKFSLFDASYEVIGVSYENVINEEGHIEIIGKRMVIDGAV